MKGSPLSSFPDYTDDIQDVIKSEQEYLHQRRLHYGENRPNDQKDHIEDPWGLAISGGGVRSATLALGMMQKFIVEGLFKKFDYMSTVSGGGFMGACLTSLMNTDSDKFVHPDHIAPGDTNKLIPGLDPYTSPLVLLMKTRQRNDLLDQAVSQKPADQSTRWAPSQMISSEDKQAKKRPPLEVMMDYTTVEGAKIDARHQVDHLRTHGEYLTPDKSIFSTSIQRLVGTFFAGFLHNFTLFILGLLAFVTLNFLVFDTLSDHDFYKQISEYQVKSNGDDNTLKEDLGNQLTSLWTDNLAVFIGNIGEMLSDHLSIVFYLVAFGFAIGFITILSQRRIIGRINAIQAKINRGEAEPSALAGYNQAEYEESGFLQKFNLLIILGGPAVSIITWLVGRETNIFQQKEYWIIFGLPAMFAAGIFLAIYFILPFLGNPSRQTRFARSFDGSIRGAALYGLIISVLMPVLILFLFTFSFLFNKLFVTLTSSLSSLISVGVGYFAMTSKPEDGNSMINNILSKLKIPAISLSVIIFVVLIASAITGVLARTSLMSENGEYLPAWLFLGSVGLFLILGTFINPNRMSLHYFYRDRLVEAYLKTDGKIKRKRTDMQGMPLVNLRNDEDLKLMNLGWRKTKEKDASDTDKDIWEPNPRGPYHLVVTALNLQGSDELVRKDLKSEHFVFSRNYIGSYSTGFVKSSVYRNGKTKLARAVTISAAAVGSGMGMMSFFAQSFLTTLLNLRLGYWMENPWYYRNNCSEETTSNWFTYRWKKMLGWEDTGKKSEDGYKINNPPERRFTFWPNFLMQELLGTSTANKRLINLSDGGHTGDNLGLLPLLQRRCKVIVVCDFEEDADYSFLSFTHAVRMASIEENIDIQIDLTKIIPRPEINRSERSVVIGEIGYPDFSKGYLVYIKSSLNLKKIPISVFNYHTQYPDFPHQTTADQFFDDTQFEAYRALGFHLAEEAAKNIKVKLKESLT